MLIGLSKVIAFSEIFNVCFGIVRLREQPLPKYTPMSPVKGVALSALNLTDVLTL